jgi:hypothetical protein
VKTFADPDEFLRAVGLALEVRDGHNCGHKLSQRTERGAEGRKSVSLERPKTQRVANIRKGMQNV